MHNTPTHSRQQRIHIFRDNVFSEQSNHEHATILTIRFVKLNGQAWLFRYLYLVAIFFEQTDKGDSITVHFTTHRVTVIGFGLQDLFLQLGEQVIGEVIEQNLRYLHLYDKRIRFIAEINCVTLNT
jgi:hypothetical protein